jgi:N-acetylmuramoyl-L-alanine amidase
LSCAIVVCLVPVPTITGAPATAREMYVAALAHEQTVRAALAQDDVPVDVHAKVRTVVGEFQEIVRLYPASGYSDNALWQAGVLSLDAFAAFGQERDRTTARRLLRLLTTEYPASSLVKEVPPQLARAEAQSPAGPAVRPAQASSAPRASLATIKGIRREVLADTVRITIEIDREVPFYEERITGPVRVFVDLPSTRPTPALVDRTIRFDGDNDIVRQIRIGRHPNNLTRVVLDAADVFSYSVYPLYEPYRLVIDCVRETQPTIMPAVLASVTPAPAEVPSRGPSSAPPDIPAVEPVPATLAPAALPAAVATIAPPRNADGGYSMARQLGLSVSRIVIDPGHGGHDPGAKGRSITEAELVLDVALRVEKLLQQVPGIEVILTRRTDEYVPLQERTAIANREGADLFLSIHANASNNSAARGVETYFLNFASNMSAASVAARENAASGQAMGALPDFLKTIALNNKLAESRDFAADVQAALVARLRKSNKSLKNLGVKQAPFVVLIGAAMPSVLAEISFLTNAQEAKLLRGNTYRERIAEALVAAIRKYQTSLKSVAKVAKQ